jgi:hypothetical protein
MPIGLRRNALDSSPATEQERSQLASLTLVHDPGTVVRDPPVWRSLVATQAAGVTLIEHVPRAAQAANVGFDP